MLNDGKYDLLGYDEWVVRTLACINKLALIFA